MTLPNPFRHAVGSTADAGATVIVPAPGQGFRISVKAFMIQQESANPTVIQLLNGDHPHWKYYGNDKGDFFQVTFSDGNPWILDANTALSIHLDGANQSGYTIMYDLERS